MRCLNAWTNDGKWWKQREYRVICTLHALRSVAYTTHPTLAEVVGKGASLSKMRRGESFTPTLPIQLTHWLLVQYYVCSDENFMTRLWCVGVYVSEHMVTIYRPMVGCRLTISRALPDNWETLRVCCLPRGRKEDMEAPLAVCPWPQLTITGLQSLESFWRRERNKLLNVAKH